MTLRRFPSLTHRDPTVLQGGVTYPITLITTDDGESYTPGVVVDNTLEGGTVNAAYPWNGRWRMRHGVVGPWADDDFDAYADGAALDGLNLGVGRWDGAWVNR